MNLTEIVGKDILRRMSQKPSFWAVGIFPLTIFLLLSGCGQRGDPPIMSYEEYRTIEIFAPYLLQASDDSGELFYFGAEHSACPQHPQMTQIEEAWSSFKPDIAFSEGGVWPLMPTRDEAISNFGEGGLLRFLAARDSVPIFSLEPSRVEEVLKLRREFDPEAIKLFYVLRQVMQYRRGKVYDEADLDAYATEVLHVFSRVAGMDSPPQNLAEFEMACPRRFPHLRDWRQSPSDWFDPLADVSITNRISRAVGRIRDVHMVKLLAEEVQQGRRVFAVAGYTHVVMQEKALRVKIGD